MECKKIQELLLTDYLDGEASDALQNEIERHVNSCHTCRQLERDLLKTVIEPLRKAKESKPPDFLWNHIKEALEKETLEKEPIVSEERGKPEGFLADLWNYLTHACHRDSLPHRGGLRHRSGLFSGPALALVTSLGVVVILMITVSRLKTNNQMLTRAYPEKQVEYLATVMGDSEYFSLEENNGYGTAIEEYFF